MSVWCHLAIAAAVLVGLQETSSEDATGSEKVDVVPLSTDDSTTKTSISVGPQIAESILEVPLETTQAKASNDPTDESKQLTEHNLSVSLPTTPQIKNDHTITANEFARITATANKKDPDEKSSQDVVTAETHAATSDKQDKPQETEVKDDEHKSGEITSDKSTSSNTQIVTSPNDKDNIATENPSETNVPPEHTEEDKTGDKEDYFSNYKDNTDSKDEEDSSSSLNTEETTIVITLSEYSNNIADEIKVYSNAAVLAWDQVKGKVPWTAEASSTLDDFMEKILLAQAANKSECVKPHLEKYIFRKKTLQDLIENCLSGLKRDDWKELQDKTKEILTKINDIVQEAIESIDKLSKEKNDFEENKALIESDSKKKLMDLDTESIKETLSKLKDKSIMTDEEDYKTCMNNKSERGMIEDTLNDIMRIKNNCVG